MLRNRTFRFSVAVILSLISTVAGFSVPARSAGSWYVKNEQLALRASPDLAGKETATLKQGTALSEVGKKGLWVEVQSAEGKRGWTLSTMLSSSPVLVGGSDSNSENSESAVKQARSRPRFRAATMGVRGLRSSSTTSASQRGGLTESDEKLENARKDLEKMEGTQPSAEEVQKVRSELIGSGKKD